MTERPIIFSAWSVQAILAGRKTQTRRMLKPQPEMVTSYHPRWKGYIGAEVVRACPYGVVGDRLWIKEVFGIDDEWDIQYRASWRGPDANPAQRGFKWRAPFYMKRDQARILLEIERVRVEPDQNISERGATAEGFAGDTWRPAKNLFRETWKKMHGSGEHAWEQNPWVWAVSFKLVEAPK